MKNIVTIITYLSITMALFVGCGSADAIKGYRYNTTKANLEKAILKVIKGNPHLYLDTIEKKVIVRRNPNDSNDTTTIAINAEDYTGPEKEEILAGYAALTKIKIKVDTVENVYVFRYLGDKQYWENSTSSEIFISEVYNHHGDSLSQGHNENGEFSSKIAKDFTDLFETEFIDKVDKELNLKHAVH